MLCVATSDMAILGRAFVQEISYALIIMLVCFIVYKLKSSQSVGLDLGRPGFESPLSHEANLVTLSQSQSLLLTYLAGFL